MLKNEKYVQSTRHIGYSNQTQMLTNTSALSSTSDPFTGTTCSVWTCTSSGHTKEQESQGAGDIGYVTDYNLVSKVFGSMKAKAPGGLASYYWLASRHFIDDGYKWYFNVRCVSSSGGLEYVNQYAYRTDGFSSFRGVRSVRPVLTLKSSIYIKSRDGKSAETAYQLQ